MNATSPVKSAADSRLQTYETKPVDIIEHYNREIESEEGYCKRPLLELLQNIEDALGESGIDSPQALIRLEGNTLWIANKGQPFDKDGFEALCDSNRSPKKGKEFIGNKGTGFKAVLNWTQKPEIHSGDIHACFDRVESERLIRQIISNEKYDDLIGKSGWKGQSPLLRVPIEIDPGSEIKNLLGEDWSTVIKLPLEAGKRTEVEKALQDFDPVNLLFLKHLSVIRFEIEGIDHEARKQEESNKVSVADADYSLFRKPSVSKPGNPEHGVQCEMAVAFPHDLKQAEAYPLFNFFPIKNAPSPFMGLLVHASFLLKQDRDELAEIDPAFHNDLADELAKLLNDEVIPALAKRHGPECLGLLKRATEQSNEQLNNIHSVLHEAVATCAFVPDTSGKFRSPRELRLWKWNLGDLLMKYEVNTEVDGGYLCHPDWQQYSIILQQYGAKKIEPLAHLQALAGCVAQDVSEALGILKVTADVNDGIEPRYYLYGWHDNPDKEKAKDIVRNFQVWKSIDGSFRTLDHSIPFFISFPDTLDEAIPCWLKADKLDHDFYGCLKEKAHF